MGSVKKTDMSARDVKAVVDAERGVMVIGAEGEGFIEFDSMINVRPSQNNLSRDVLDEAIRARIREVVARLVVE